MSSKRSFNRKNNLYKKRKKSTAENRINQGSYLNQGSHYRQKLLDEEFSEDFKGLSQEELLQKHQQLEAELPVLIKELGRTTTSEEEAVFNAESLIHIVNLTAGAESIVPSQLRATQMLAKLALEFQIAGFTKAEYILKREMVRQIEMFLEREDAASEEKSKMENLLAMVSQQASTLAIELDEEFETVNSLFVTAYNTAESLEKRGELLHPEVYGEILLIQKARLIAAGKENEARKLDEKIKKYANKDLLEEAKEIFKNR